jgi:hypothetical protein
MWVWKDHGLPERYRLYWVFSDRYRTIIFLYLNDVTTHLEGSSLGMGA